VFLSVFKCLKKKEVFLEVLSIKDQIWGKLYDGIDHTKDKHERIRHRIERKVAIERYPCDRAHTGDPNAERLFSKLN
jgi:hypothetical protein